MSDQPARGPVPVASRYGLVRPLQGRYVAGVCGALARATGTDTVLWRVVLAVLICFGGLGVLCYVLLWLLTPEEGDTASPVEALLGRGHSNTSPVVAAVLAAVAAVLLVFILSQPLHVVLLAVTVGLTAALVAHRTTRGARPATPAPPPPPPPPPPSPPAPRHADGPDR
jgi:phage shock protein PspC (stress-responsive transcriptional regulator)